MSSQTNKSTPRLSNQIALLHHLVEGLRKHFASTTTVVVRGTSYSPDELAKVLEDLANVYQAVFDAKSKAHDAILTARAASKGAGLIARAFRGLVYASFKDAGDLADFGLTPRKTRAPATVEQLQVAAEKRRATRAARHTLGKRQKAAIKGVVPPPTVTPSSATGGGGVTPPKAATGSPA